MKFLQIKKKKKIALTNGACSYGLVEGKMHREKVWRGLELHADLVIWDYTVIETQKAKKKKKALELYSIFVVVI